MNRPRHSLESITCLTAIQEAYQCLNSLVETASKIPETAPLLKTFVPGPQGNSEVLTIRPNSYETFVIQRNNTYRLSDKAVDWEVSRTRPALLSNSEAQATACTRLQACRLLGITATHEVRRNIDDSLVLRYPDSAATNMFVPVIGERLSELSKSMPLLLEKLVILPVPEVPTTQELTPAA